MRASITLIVASVVLAAPLQAQVSPKEITLAGINDCIKEAITTNSVDDAGAAIILSCNTVKAKTLFNFLGRKVRLEVVQDKNGKFENRQFGNNACYHRIEDPNGKAADEFRCDLILSIGDQIGE